MTYAKLEGCRWRQDPPQLSLWQVLLPLRMLLVFVGMDTWRKAERDVLQTWLGWAIQFCQRGFFLQDCRPSFLSGFLQLDGSCTLINCWLYINSYIFWSSGDIYCLTPLLNNLAGGKKSQQPTNPCQFGNLCSYDWHLPSTAGLRPLQVGIPSPELINSVLLLPLIYCHRNRNKHWKSSIFVYFLHKELWTEY